jgi:glycosyltransferase involved in cell wall biosynthesis
MSRSPADARVAVIVPVYHATFLTEALESIFSQSRQPDDVIVIDDGSPDREALHDALAPHAGRVRLLHQHNCGAGAARNRGMAAADAEFVAFLDADDRWLPDFLAHQLQAFARRPELDMLYADGLIIGTTPLAGRTYMAECPSTGPVTVASLLDLRCNVLLSTVVARRTALLAVGGFDESLRRGHDADLWFRLARHGALIDYQRSVLILRRVHDGNLSGDNGRALERAAGVFEHVLATHPLTHAERLIAGRRLREIRAGVEYERGKDLLVRGEFAAARRAWLEARRTRRGWKLHAAWLCLHVAPALVRRLYLARIEARPLSWAR